MTTPETKYPGYYESTGLPDVSEELVTSFTTDGWADTGMLYTGNPGQELIYPHIADKFAGYLPGWGEGDNRHPLRYVEVALHQDLHSTDQSLRLFSRAVGQVVANEGGWGIREWQRTDIAREYKKIPNIDLTPPEPLWTLEDFSMYYQQVRAVEANRLRVQVTELAGRVVAQNAIEPLYVAWESTLCTGVGWLAPLIGLCIDTGKINNYRSQVHNVLPVVRQNDNTVAQIREATLGVYTKYAPRHGVGK